MVSKTWAVKGLQRHCGEPNMTEVKLIRRAIKIIYFTTITYSLKMAFFKTLGLKMSKISITGKEIEYCYEQLKVAHNKFLKQYNVSLPRLKNGSKFTKDAIVLSVLFKYIGKAVSKTDLTRILKKICNDEINDAQQGRHLGRQKGWYILSGTRNDNIPPELNITLISGDYCLVSVNKPYPTRTLRAGHHRIISSNLNFDRIKLIFDHRCATCGSKEGELNFRNKSRKTKLQAGHQNPNHPLVPGNIIPQCGECNQAYRDWFYFDGSGRVTDININSPKWGKKYKIVK